MLIWFAIKYGDIDNYQNMILIWNYIELQLYEQYSLFTCSYEGYNTIGNITLSVVHTDYKAYYHVLVFLFVNTNCKEYYSGLLL